MNYDNLKETLQEHQVYNNPLVGRYASREMAELWGARRKFSTWRRLWVALAEAQHELEMTMADGKPRITDSQIATLRAKVDDIDFAKAEHHERRLRHDVMAHIYTYGEACPEAADIIHLGATSCYVTDNTDLLLMREGLGLVRNRLARLIDALARFAEKYQSLETLGFTHFQPAQLTTVGKRACLWCQDFIFDLNEIEYRLATLKFRGAKGATGTQASFLALFRGNHDKVKKLDRLIASKMGFNQVYPVTGQTYSRKIDSQVLDVLSGVGQSAHKFGTDLRLLSHCQELDEPFEKEQVGSSAMAYKRNPMRAERMCGLARFAMALAANGAQTEAVQWLERSLDDSVNRRLTLPQAFLSIDAVLCLAINIAAGMTANPEVIARNVEQVFPYMATENLLMAAVAQGGDRQQLHECIRLHSHEVIVAMKTSRMRNDLLDRLKSDPFFAGVDFAAVLAEGYFAGRSAEQVQEFLTTEVALIRARFGNLHVQNTDISI